MSGRLFGADTGVSTATLENDLGNVDQSFHVVDDCGLAEQARLRGEWRFISGLAAIAFDRIEKSRFLAADVCSGTTTDFHIELERRAHDSLAQEPLRPRGFYCMGQTISSQRIFSAYIDEALLGTDSQSSNRHALQNGKRIAFHQDAVFERAGLGLIGIADDVMGAARASLKQHPFPFLSGGESRASPA